MINHYRDNRQNPMLLSGVEFLRRFILHIMSKGYVSGTNPHSIITGKFPHSLMNR